ncbi:hypothetical protein CHLRE_01g030100v5 [Chlamydomonas reinhardtii]|uniref:Protein kinase domain-containing protein n=1 Tax=Chlamydomonas reinhardtii TaxID=3055 RepID=A0A2K3E6P3_CHLRE|nr:uncharacterized protein CHLRE_01g030100v5 [Chlamydomonas reinhardtii]PNW88450.1 hypothetical protein CHLRE_01g030100v5 [Chlamydomonas reinhardtii]
MASSTWSAASASTWLERLSAGMPLDIANGDATAKCGFVRPRLFALVECDQPWTAAATAQCTAGDGVAAELMRGGCSASRPVLSKRRLVPLPKNAVPTASPWLHGGRTGQECDGTSGGGHPCLAGVFCDYGLSTEAEGLLLLTAIETQEPAWMVRPPRSPSSSSASAAAAGQAAAVTCASKAAMGNDLPDGASAVAALPLFVAAAGGAGVPGRSSGSSGSDDAGATAGSAPCSAKASGGGTRLLAVVALLEGATGSAQTLLRMAGAVVMPMGPPTAPCTAGAHARGVLGGQEPPAQLQLAVQRRLLQPMATALSAWLAGNDMSRIAWLAVVLRRLYDSDTMEELTSALCGAVEEHVAREVPGVEAGVRLALVQPPPPPRPSVAADAARDAYTSRRRLAFFLVPTAASAPHEHAPSAEPPYSTGGLLAVATESGMRAAPATPKATKTVTETAIFDVDRDDASSGSQQQRLQPLQRGFTASDVSSGGGAPVTTQCGVAAMTASGMGIAADSRHTASGPANDYVGTASPARVTVDAVGAAPTAAKVPPRQQQAAAAAASPLGGGRRAAGVSSLQLKSPMHVSRRVQELAASAAHQKGMPRRALSGNLTGLASSAQGSFAGKSKTLVIPLTATVQQQSTAKQREKGSNLDSGASSRGVAAARDCAAGAASTPRDLARVPAASAAAAAGDGGPTTQSTTLPSVLLPLRTAPAGANCDATLLDNDFVCATVYAAGPQLHHSGTIPSSAALSGLLVGGGSVRGGIHAQAFELRGTLLAAALAAKAAAVSAPVGGGAAARPAAAADTRPDAAAVRPPAGRQQPFPPPPHQKAAGSTDAAVLVVEDVNKRLQDVARPCADLCMLMAPPPPPPPPQTATAFAADAGLAASQRRGAACVPSDTRRFLLPTAAACDAAVNAGGGTAAGFSSGLNPAAAPAPAAAGRQQLPFVPPHSVALLTFKLPSPPAGGQDNASLAAGGGGDDAAAAAGGRGRASATSSAGGGEGAALGLYLCFETCLPRALLEAVRASCQELLDLALGPALEALLAGPLSAEFATLCTAKPGGGGAAAGPMTYAVIKTASTTQQLQQQQHLLRQESLLAATSAADTPAADADAVTGSRFAPCGLTSADTPAAGAASFYDTALMTLMTGGSSNAPRLPPQQRLAAAAAAACRRDGGASSAALPMKPFVVTRSLFGTGSSFGGDRALLSPRAQTAAADGPTTGAAAAAMRRAISQSLAAVGPAAAAALRSLAGSSSAQARGNGSNSFAAQLTAAAAAGAYPQGAATASTAGGASADAAARAMTLVTTSWEGELPLPAGGEGSGQGSHCNSHCIGASEGGAAAAPAGFPTTTGRVSFSSASNSTSYLMVLAPPEAPATAARQQLELLESMAHQQSAAAVTGGPLVTGSVYNIGGASASAVAQGGATRGLYDSGRFHNSFAEDLVDLELIQVLGYGAAGVVFKAQWCGMACAVKLMEVPTLEDLVETCGGGAGAGSPAEGTGTVAAAAGAVVTRPPQQERTSAAADNKELLAMRYDAVRRGVERGILQHCSHPSIIQVYSSFSNMRLMRSACGSRYRLVPDAQVAAAAEDAGNGDGGCAAVSPLTTAVVFELADMGSLSSALVQKIFPRPLPAPRTATWGTMTMDVQGVYMVLLDVALALRHLHSMNIVHRDVKAANLLLKSSTSDPRGFTVKLADFGFAMRLTELAEDGATRYAVSDQACGTVTHMAPEILKTGTRITCSSDIYAFGVLMWEVLHCGRRPYPEITPEQIPTAVIAGARPVFIGNHMPPPFRTTAAACWAADPRKRPTAAELVVALAGQVRSFSRQ